MRIMERACPGPAAFCVSFSTSAGAWRSAQVYLALVQQAPAEMPVGREARPVAGAAERFGHRGDDPDLSPERAAVPLERVVDQRRAGAGVVQASRLEPELLLEPGADAGGGEHLQLLAPAVSLEWHILDVPHLDG